MTPAEVKAALERARTLSGSPFGLMSADVEALAAKVEKQQAQLAVAVEALEWIAPFLRGNGHAVFAEQIDAALTRIRGEKA